MINWTGETGYAADGLSPESGDRNASYVYRLKFSDSDNAAPAADQARKFVFLALRALGQLGLGHGLKRLKSMPAGIALVIIGWHNGTPMSQRHKVTTSQREC